MFGWDFEVLAKVEAISWTSERTNEGDLKDFSDETAENKLKTELIVDKVPKVKKN